MRGMYIMTCKRTEGGPGMQCVQILVGQFLYNNSSSDRSRLCSSSVSSEFGCTLLDAACERLRTTGGGFDRGGVVICPSARSTTGSYCMLYLNARAREVRRGGGEFVRGGVQSGERNCLSISSDSSNMLFDDPHERWRKTARVCRGGEGDRRG